MCPDPDTFSNSLPKLLKNQAVLTEMFWMTLYQEMEEHSTVVLVPFWAKW